MTHEHPQTPLAPGPRDRTSDRDRTQLGRVLGAAGDGCMACADEILATLTEPSAVGRLVEIARRTAVLLNDGALPGYMTSGLSDLASEEFCHLARTITEAGNPAGAAGRMTEGQRRAASRSAARILVEHAGSSYQTARDRAAAGVPTLPDVCLSQAALMSTWWTHTDPRSADVHTGWRQACDEASMRAMEPVGEATAVYVLGAVFHSVAQETNTRADAFQTLPYTRGLPLIRNSEAAARIVTNFVSPPQWEETGFVAKRLAIYLPTAPMFRVLRLWADLLCAAHAADCPQQGPGHECTLSDRTAALAPHSNVAA